MPSLAWTVFLSAVSAPAQQTEWVMHKTADGQHPSPAEQQMVWLMNRARANPTAEGIFLTNTGDPTTVEAMAVYHVDQARMKAEFAAIPPAPPTTFDRRLYEASRKHALYMISVDTQTHDTQNALLNASGFAWASAMLSVFAYCDNGLMAHAGLNIDYGGPDSEGGMQVNRGHRVAIMSYLAGTKNLSSVGLALVPENNDATEVGPLVFSGSYASAKEGAADEYNRFVVGTVWNDRNKNKMYDEGEGLSGVRVQLDHGNYFAVTGLAGGFSIPVTTPGNYVISYSGGSFPGFFSAALTIGADSVLADSEINTLPTTKVPFTSALRLDPSGALRLSWSGGKPPYQVQRTGDLTGGWQNAGAPTMENSATLPFDGPRGFFQVLDSE